MHGILQHREASLDPRYLAPRRGLCAPNRTNEISSLTGNHGLPQQGCKMVEKLGPTLAALKRVAPLLKLTWRGNAGSRLA